MAMRLSLEKQKHGEASIILEVTCSLVLNIAFCLFYIPLCKGKRVKKQKQGWRGRVTSVEKAEMCQNYHYQQAQWIVKGAFSLGSCVC